MALSWANHDDARLLASAQRDQRRAKRVLSLCDYSGVMVEPWLRAGYEATIVDLQHEERFRRVGHNLYRVGADVREWKPLALQYHIVFAFPPCTDLAVSGARWYRDKGLRGLIDALEVVEACRVICEESGAPYMIENPVGQLSTYWRKPDHAFDPLDFGAYVLAGEQYTKRTHLWTGGGFVMPKKRPLPKSDEPNPILHAPPGPERANFRSLTPRGFAQAVFEANDPIVCGAIRETEANDG